MGKYRCNHIIQALNNEQRLVAFEIAKATDNLIVFLARGPKQVDIENDSSRFPWNRARIFNVRAAGQLEASRLCRVH